MPRYNWRVAYTGRLMSRSTQPSAELAFKVMTVNTHKGFTFFNRKFILHELRDAVRAVGADVVFLQEVQGTHEKHPRRFINWPEAPHYEFLADAIWPRVRLRAQRRLPARPPWQCGAVQVSDRSLPEPRRVDQRPGAARPAALRAARAWARGRDARHLRAPGPAEAHRRKQLELLCHLVDDPGAARRAAAGRRRLQRLAAPRAPRAGALRRPARGVRARPRPARRSPSRHAGRCWRSTASTCATRACTRRWCCRAGRGRTCRTTPRWSRRSAL